MTLEDFERENISKEELSKARKKAPFLEDLVEKFLLVTRMVESAVIKREYKVNKFDLMKLIGVILYVVCPFDMVPDAIPVVGYGDDVMMLKMVLDALGNIIDDYEKFEKSK